jgi:hypothetical protein
MYSQVINFIRQRVEISEAELEGLESRCANKIAKGENTFKIGAQ